MDCVDLSDYADEGTLHEIFRNQVKRTPDKIAVFDHDGRTITFRQLDEWTDIVATNLMNQGCRLGSVVGVLMERCLEWSISYIAVHKVGGGYLPLETSYPPALLESVLEDARPSVIITKGKYLSRLENTSVPIVLLDNDFLSILTSENKKHPSPTYPQVNLDDVAYVVYSSGTTGKPKGIVCPHRGAVHAYKWRFKACPYDENEREACNVFFVWEMLRPLLKGIPMYIISDETIYDPPHVTKFIKENRITRILFTPSLLETIIKYKGVDVSECFKTLRIIIFCGEVVTTSVRDQIASLCPWIKLLNLYSISECHDVSCADISNPNGIKEGRQYCSVGKTLPYVQMITLDEEFKETKMGTPGDVYIGGPALAIGYLNRPDLNKAKFIQTPEHLRKTCGDRLYSTGDWGYALGDGTFEIIGRSDSMVKIRGYTIELQAIEVALRGHPAVKSCCVLCIGEEGQNKVLVAYIVNSNSISTSELRAYLKTKFPFYMIPSKYFFLDTLPILKSSGKLNKKELPTLDSNSELELDENMSPLEKNIAKIWCQVLFLYTIEKDENFFDLGGHSLAAALCISQMNEDMSLSLSVADLFSHPTVQLMASFLENHSNPTLSLDFNNEIEINSYKNSDESLNSRVQCFWKSMQLNNSKLHNGNVLLTGATGYLGIHLMHKFLTDTKCTLYCTVREEPNKTLTQRIAEIIEKYGIPLHLNQYLDRLVLIKSDLSLDMLGLKNKDEYISLSYEIDMVVHAAAFVNLILPYHALSKSNVVATKNLIEFSFLNKIKGFHYVSTNAIYPATGGDYSEDYKVADFHQYLTTSSGYGQAKLVSESLVLRAGQLGLPVTIVRCGNIGGSLSFNNWNHVDFNLYLLQAITTTGLSPHIDWYLELTPVDFLTTSLVQLYTNVNHMNKIYNFINTKPISGNTLVSALNAIGYTIKTVPYTKWLEELTKSKQAEPLLQILQNKDQYLTVKNSYSNKNTESFLKSSNLTYPITNEHTVKQYMNVLRLPNLVTSVKQVANTGEVVARSNGNGFSVSKTGQVNIVYDNTLADKVIFVTGCSSGIGEALVKDLVLLGAKVVAVARRITRLEKLKTSLEDARGRIVVKKLDVTVEEDVKRVVQEVIAEYGHIDILVNNAGVMYFTLVEKYTLAEWNAMVDVNVKGVLHCIGNILPSMLQSQRPGHIVNISSNAGVRPFAGLAVYTGTKYFIEGLSGALRQEVSDRNIKVTCIQAGDIKTELLSHSTDKEVVDKFDVSATVPVLTTKEISQSIVFALLQPNHSAVNSILIEPPLASI
uniref:Linear gramicidin synthase subunit D n=1 Tax=Cacopsylla melanoneura TaxID=428564 RepID=A0A8D8VTW3_9HEMI